MSRTVRMALSYLTLLIFTLFALAPILRAFELVFGDAVVSTPVPNFSTLPNLTGQAALVALAVTIGGTALASAIAFALARWRSRPRSDVVRHSPLPQIVPALVLLLALGFVLFSLGLLNAALWILAVYLVTAAPVCVWQLTRAYRNVLPAVEEAAAIDGCGSWRSFYSIVLPAVAPALILTALFSFAVAWDDYFVLGAGPQSTPPAINLGNLWSAYSVVMLFAALLLGFCMWLFGRRRAASSNF
jgi:ABC-type maltose transport system permease subunit